MKRMRSAAAILLAAILLLNLWGPTALASQADTITIRTAEDLLNLSRSCSLDRWSQGKTVVLAQDVDLTGTSFSSIPTFGGVFDGQGHTISGLSLTGSGNVQGLFRYIQPGGVVKNLTVSGSVTPTDFRDTIGGIAGSNQGQLLHCAFRGVVKGDTSVGGVAGVNEAGGQIISCSFSGSLEGTLHAGGIAGQNLGSIVQCVNRGAINPVIQESSADPLDVSMEAVGLSVWTDVGGIAGYSTGILQSCRNEGAVGYAHVGYNIGGIAGRQSGCLDGCVNTGAVLGRKDVGGIAGQLEPEMTLLFSESFLQRLGGELETLQGLTDGLLRDAGQISDDLTARARGLTDQTRTVQAAVDDLGDAMADWTDTGLGQINDLSARLSRALDRLMPALDTAEDQLDQLSQAASDLAQALEDAEALGTLGGESAAALRRAIESIRSLPETCRSALNQARRAAEAVRDALGDEAKTQEALTQLTAAVKSLLDIFPRHLEEAAGQLQSCLRSLEQSGQVSQDVLRSLRDGGDTLADVLSHLADSAAAIDRAAEELTDGPAIQIPSLSSAVTAQADALDVALSGLTDQADQLTGWMSSSTDTVLADLRAISAQLGVIARLLEDEGARAQDVDLADRFEDVSDQQNPEDQTTGRLSSSRNEGTVEGDLDVAGIVGAVAIDRDFDPEDDLTVEGQRSLNFWFQTKAAVFDCVNTGAVTGKKDYAGGIIGRMDMGRTQRCENYGDVCSTDGDYVGGVAGGAWGTLESCWSRCTLSGSHYIGGIAGLGSDLTACRAMVTVSGGSAYVGAVAGDLEEGGTLTGNLFTSETLAAVDGVSYADRAEPVSLEALCALEDAPKDFAVLTITFVADGRVISTVPVRYGQGVENLPALPPREGYSAAWPALDYSCVTASQTVEALYTPYAASLAGEGTPPQFLVEGSFSPEAHLSHRSEEVTWTDAGGTTHKGTAWTVTVEDPVLPVSSCTIHYRLPEEGGRWAVWVLGEDGWQIRPHQTDGQYLLIPGDGAETTFCVLPAPFPAWIIAAAVLGPAALLGAVILLRHRRRRVSV